MDRRISVDVDIISSITRLPLIGFYPSPFFSGKEQDLGLVNRMKEKYKMSRDKRGFSIASINDTIVQFAMKILSSKLLRKMGLNQCTIGTIIVEEQFVVGV